MPKHNHEHTRMSIQKLRGEQFQSDTRKKIAIAVSATMSIDIKTLANFSGLSISTVGKNLDHAQLILNQELRKLTAK